jgi:hypothetical protein
LQRHGVLGLQLVQQHAECSIGVDNVDATAAAVAAHGGKIVMPKVTIPTVGHLIFLQDPEGNLAGAMQYDSAAD